MKINNTELIRLGTPKFVKKLTKHEKVLEHLKKYGETTGKELDASINGYGHFSEIMRTLMKQRKVRLRRCRECKETIFYKLI